MPNLQFSVKEVDQSGNLAVDEGDDNEEIFGEDNAEKIDNAGIEKNLEEPEVEDNIGSRKKTGQGGSWGLLKWRHYVGDTIITC